MRQVGGVPLYRPRNPLQAPKTWFPEIVALVHEWGGAAQGRPAKAGLVD